MQNGPLTQIYTRVSRKTPDRRSDNGSDKKEFREGSANSGKYYESFSRTRISFGELNEIFALSVTAHGFARIALTKKHRLRQIFWTLFVIAAMCGFLYHISFLLSNYFDYPVSTSTEEIHATELDFPTVTICNLNNVKKTKFEAYLMRMAKEQDDVAKQTTELPDFLATTAASSVKGSDDLQCFRTTDEIVNRSRTMDLSDMWINLVTTKRQIREFGHQAADMIVQCTYNSKDCFNTSSSIVSSQAYSSPRYGLCHSLTLKDADRLIQKSGAGLGLQFTINIERPEYLDIVSGEFGARILVHAVGSRPSLDTGGIILQPGTKTYIAAKMRQIVRLPDPFRGCTMNFSDSPLTEHLKKLKLDHLIGSKMLYTLEYCQTVCTEAYLYRACNCLDELAVERPHEKFSSCDPCNADQSRCRRAFYRGFTGSQGGKICSLLCRAECNEIRYDITTSQSEWPNLRQEYLAVTRFPEVNKRLEQSGINWTLVPESTDEQLAIMPGVDEFRRNYLRVHVYMQEMNYMRVKDESSYLMSQLIADLGGCLGLYIGVSVISLMEFTEHFMRCSSYGCKRQMIPLAKKITKRFAPKILRRGTTRRTVAPLGDPSSRFRETPRPPPPPIDSDEGVLSKLSRRRPHYFRRDRNESVIPQTPNQIMDPREWMRRDNYQQIVQARQRLQNLAQRDIQAVHEGEEFSLAVGFESEDDMLRTNRRRRIIRVKIEYRDLNRFEFSKVEAARGQQ
ncbi:acid-sensing ion channel 1A [Galendromus occidentalis]|uniref:Acid-sensing ion channel 1A n=1 Tax=Galendromus occidentalis TaxID=34638 RepID=A0AAJ7SDW0_9ACAR|nr:acid-sensing ion channel 1A [Galendromus occidentalis]